MSRRAAAGRPRAAGRMNSCGWVSKGQCARVGVREDRVRGMCGIRKRWRCETERNTRLVEVAARRSAPGREKVLCRMRVFRGVVAECVTSDHVRQEQAKCMCRLLLRWQDAPRLSALQPRARARQLRPLNLSSVGESEYWLQGSRIREQDCRQRKGRYTRLNACGSSSLLSKESST